MLPVAYQLPAGVILLVAGLLSCFAGYRLFRTVLTVYGFVLGALFASTLVAPSNTSAMLIALAVGGLAGALILFAAYFAGVMLVGGVLGAVLVHSGWLLVRGVEPNILIVILAAVVGAAAAYYAQRSIVILATAFGGAQMAVAGAVAILAGRAPHLRGVDDVWIGHLAPGLAWRQWPFLAWIVLGAIGALIQFKSGGRKSRRRR
jgi:hypothetical protein